MVLMIVKGTKFEFKLGLLKNVKENEKFHNTFYLFIYFLANAVSHPGPCKQTLFGCLGKSVLTFM